MAIDLKATAVEKNIERPPAPKIKNGRIYFEDGRPPGVRIFFYPVANHGIREYRVYKDGIQVKKIDPRDIHYEFFEELNGLGKPWTRKKMAEYAKKEEKHYYEISAIDTAGNESPLSERLYIDSFERIYMCFAGNTPVLMADGSLKNIQDIRPGDRVASYDFKKTRRVSADVTAIMPSETTSYLVINDLKVTDHHPFAVGPDQWKEAGELRVGDRVAGLGNEITIKEISRANEKIEVYDLRVSSFSNFYVFNDESFFLVHNKD